MKAAVIRTAGAAPEYGEFDDPQRGDGEELVSVRASAVNRLTLSRAAGAHYSGGARPPLVPGVDGVGVTSDGRRVYFQLPRAPYGALAERAPVPVSNLVRVPDGLDDATAAAVAIPGMSCWLPLHSLAPIRPGDSVIVNGATGASGTIAVQVAKHLGARSVIALGRSPAELEAVARVGADTVLPLSGDREALRLELRSIARAASVGVVLDYLWGPPAETILAALGGPDAPRGPARVRFVQVGALAGPTIALDGALLRSSGVELVGSGIGSATPAAVLASIGEFFGAYRSAGFTLELDRRPLSEVGGVWGSTGGARRIVLTVDDPGPHPS